MKKFVLMTVTVLSFLFSFAQVDTTLPAPLQRRLDIGSRSNDHLMIQLGYAGWSGKPDSISTGGLPRTFNAYFLFDFPFKTNNHFSAAIGAGIATDNIYFDDMEIGITEQTPNLNFKDVSDTNHFKKYKLTTAWVEAPIELRYSSNPSDNSKSVKFALGAKFGLLLKSHTKGKTLQNKDNDDLNAFTQKLSSKRYFNTNRVSGTARIGYGNFSLFGSYSFTTLFKEGVAAEIRPYSIGLTLSGF